MQQLTQVMTIFALQKLADQMYGNLIKAVVDVERKVVAIDAELHADLEHFLLEQGSSQQNLWGINLHPNLFGTDDFIEYDSMINLRPNHANMTRSVDDPTIREMIQSIIQPLFRA